MNPSPTPYPDLNEVLKELVRSIQDILRGNLIGVYLQGSFAVGDFDEHSDVDWIAVTRDELSDTEVDALQQMHERIYQISNPWAQHLEGSYFPQAVLRDPAQKGSDLWYLDHGSRSLIRSNHCNTTVVRWVVRDFGVMLAGPPSTTLLDPIPVEMLRHDIMEMLNRLGQEIFNHPDPYRNRFYQTFVVLHYCRMLHDLKRGRPGSKRAGAEWAKATLDPRWRGLIDRTWAGRPDPATSVRQPADPQDFEAMLEFVRYCIGQAKLLENTL